MPRQVSRDQLLQAYRMMKTIREFEERLHTEFATGTVPGFVHLYAGEEASATGVCMHLTNRDAVAGTHRSHGHSLAKGCDVNAMMMEIYGKRDGLCGGKGGSMHVADMSKGMLGANGIVGAGAPLACGAALSAKVLKTGAVAIAFLGDGALNQGATMEAFNLASIWKLPVVFVVEDNGYAQATLASYAVSGDPVKRAAGFGIPSLTADGFDFFAVHEAAGTAIEGARAGDGPTLLHFKLTRYFGHFEGDAMTYRPTGEAARLRAEQDCLLNFRKRVTEAGLVKAEQLDAIDAETLRAIDHAVQAAKAAAVPGSEQLHTDVYAAY